MPKLSVNILTKNRADKLRYALSSLRVQSFFRYETRENLEVIVISDGSLDIEQEKLLEKEFIESGLSIRFIFNNQSLGITTNRKTALEISKGEYVSIVDDDDIWSGMWADPDKLTKQVNFLDSYPSYVLVGGAMKVINFNKQEKVIKRPKSDFWIRSTMLLRNNFFTSTVMFRKNKAIEAGGFIKDEIDLAEDYDLWLRLGKLGKMYNFQEVFTLYQAPSYSKEKFGKFLQKQKELIVREKNNYAFFWPAFLTLKFRLWLNNLGL